jgi:hypothetical protein
VDRGSGVICGKATDLINITNHFITKKIFCECCGMQLRDSPAEREYKEKLNKKRKLGIV